MHNTNVLLVWPCMVKGILILIDLRNSSRHLKVWVGKDEDFHSMPIKGVDTYQGDRNHHMRDLVSCGFVKVGYCQESPNQKTFRAFIHLVFIYLFSVFSLFNTHALVCKAP